MEAILRRVLCMMTAVVAGGCGARTPIEDCGPAGPVLFHRPTVSTPCRSDGSAGLFSIETPEDWQAHCGPGEPTIDLSREVVVGYSLEGDCKYSGCTGHAPLITAITKRGCTLGVETRDLAPLELGPCRACVQPRDVVLVDRHDAVGVFELETP